MSDDEYRNRDKFARERDNRPMRSDYGPDRNRYSGGGMKRGYGRRDDEPNEKRSRFDSAADSFEPQFNRKPETSSRILLTFKKFLATQDENISDEEAIRKYNEYKLDFRKQECEKFFAEHKDEEWFQIKYHPVASKEHAEKNRANLQKRLDIYNELIKRGEFAGQLRLEVDNCEKLIRFMDAVVVRLEDGNGDDIAAMMREPIQDEALDEVRKKLSNGSGGSEEKNGNDSTANAAENATNGTNIKREVEEDSDDMKTLLKRVPYKTNSIFFRNIPVSAKLEEIENECKNYPGFLRIGLSEPLADQKFTRRLWVSFRRDVKIKDIFWNIKNAKFAEGEAQASVNRDLRRRVRTVNGIAHHRPIVQNDIRQAARLIALFDHKRQLFLEEKNEEIHQEEAKDLDTLVGRSKNPVLDGIFEYLVEETNAEEEELLGLSTQDTGDLKFPLEVDKSLLNYLDKLLVYLRVVHSIDYYNHVEYNNEDSMPNRMGMLHVRDFPLSGDEFGKTDAGIPLVPKKSVENFISNNDERLKATILKFEHISEDDLKRLGKKDPEQAVENFIQENCVELSKEKWLCPLSGKKFKGPEFIRKHLFSKHEQKLDETRNEAIYFNNYISDPDRPQNPEPKAPANAPAAPTNDEPPPRRADGDRFSGSGGYRNSGGWNDRPPRFSGGGGPRFGGGVNRSMDYGAVRNNNRVDDFGTARRDPRMPPNYRDLDAPEHNII